MTPGYCLGTAAFSEASALDGCSDTDHPRHAVDHAHQQCHLHHGQCDRQQDHPDQDNGACRDQSALPEPLEGVPGRELRVIPLQGTLDLIEPALVALGERHDSFSPPGTRST